MGREGFLLRGIGMKLKLILCMLLALAMPGSADRVDDLIEDLMYGETTVRSNAAHSLGEIGDPRAVDPLIETLKDGNARVRSSAAYSLGEIGDPRAVDPLIETLMDAMAGTKYQYNYMASAAAEALGKIGDPRAVDPLLEALKEEDWVVRRDAAFALGEIGDPRAIDSLTYVAQNEIVWPKLQQAAEEAIEKIKTVESVEPDEALTSAVEVPIEPEETSTNAVEPLINAEEMPTNAEENPSNAKESPLPISIGAISLIAAVLFMKSKGDQL